MLRSFDVCLAVGRRNADYYRHYGCTTGSLEPSHVLTALGIPADVARGSLRLSLGRTTTDAEIDRAAAVIPATIARLAAARPRLTTVAPAGAVA